MTYALRYVALSDVGRVRSVNQDSGYASGRLLVVADGMGGAAAGDLASSEALHVMTRLDRELEGDAVEAVAGTVHRANDRLAEIIEDDPMVEGMGTTVTAMLFDGEEFALAHIGDSRAYRLRDGRLTQLTDDHTFVQSLVDEGRITPAEARTHPHKSVILRVLLGRDDCEPDLSRVDVAAGDRFLICSDGLSGMVSDPEIARVLGARTSETIDVAAVELVRLALAAGGNDNITCVIAEVLDAEGTGADGDAEPATPAEDPHVGPMLVGAAVEQPRPRSARTPAAAAVPPPADDQPAPAEPPATVDPEELRYAPRPPRRFAVLRRVLAVLVVLALLALAGRLAYDWSQDQYYVSEDDGTVAIYRGVPESVPGITLSHVEQATTIDVDSLPAFSQEQVQDGLEADGLDSARSIVANLEGLADECARPNPDADECEGAEPTTDPTSGGAGGGGTGGAGSGTGATPGTGGGATGGSGTTAGGGRR